MDTHAFFSGLSEVFASGRKEQVSAYRLQHRAQTRDADDRGGEITVLNEMVGYYRSISLYRESISAAEEALALMHDMGYAGTVSYGTTLLNAATAYKAAEEPEKAFVLYQEALDIYEKQLEASDRRLAGLYNNISSLHQEKGEDEASLALLQKALVIIRSSGYSDSETATILTNIAQVLMRLGRQEEAREKLQHAMTLFEGNGTDLRRDPHYAAALAGMGQLYYQLGEHPAALQAYESALAHILQCYGENKDYALTCANCAVVLEAMGKEVLAKEYSSKAEAIEKEIERAGTPGNGSGSI